MGFMDKLRSMASAVTGGNATVQVEAVTPRQDGPFTVNVQAAVGGSDVKVDKVYLKLMGVETVTLEVDMPVVPGSADAPKPEAPNPAAPKANMNKDLSKGQTATPQVVTQAAPATPTTVKKEISRSAQTHMQEFEVSGAQTLSANQTYTWDVEIQLPPDAKPRYQGVNANHDWKILAGLSTFGNDPDSGWQVLEF